jgi:HPt (histidine-containing phosphotransfer) domain-containing protein
MKQASGSDMARRDIKGVVDFGYLEDFAAGDASVIDEVLEIFREQAAIWARLLDPGQANWRDAVHTIKGAARSVGAFSLGEACAWAEAKGDKGIPAVRDALDAALADIAAYAHERALTALRTPRRPGEA